MQWQKNYQAHSFLYSPCHTRIKGEHVFVCVFPICITEAAVWKFPGPSNNKIRAFSLMTLWTKNHCAGMRTGLDCISLTIIARQQLGNTFLCLWGIIVQKVHVISNFVSSSLMSPLISNHVHEHITRSVSSEILTTAVMKSYIIRKSSDISEKHVASIFRVEV